MFYEATNTRTLKIYKGPTEPTGSADRVVSLSRWQSYCPRCHLVWVRRNERSGRRSFRRHMELVHGAQSGDPGGAS